MSLDIKKVFFVGAIALIPATTLAMEDSVKENEDNSLSLVATRAITISSKEDEDESIAVLTWNVMPKKLLLPIFSFLDVLDLEKAAQSSKPWQGVASDPIVWSSLGLRIYGEYLTALDLQVDPKKKVVQHSLYVLVNTKTELSEIKRLIQHYGLGFYLFPFKRGFERLLNLISVITDIQDKEELIAQGCIQAIHRKIEGMLAGEYGYLGSQEGPRYAQNIQAARELNDEFVKKDDLLATNRKIEELYGSNRYRQLYCMDAEAARELNDILVAKGDNEAIQRKLYGISCGGNSYRVITDVGGYNRLGYQITSGYTKQSPTFGYEKNPRLAREYNDNLIERGDEETIKRKLTALWQGDVNGATDALLYGYRKDPEEARKFNEELIKKGNQHALHRKIQRGLLRGEYGYQRDYEAARQLNDSLADDGDQKAIQSKVDRLLIGWWGHWNYEGTNSELARELFNEGVLKKGNVEALTERLERLQRERNYPIMRSFIEEDLIYSDNHTIHAIGHYLKSLGLKYGLLAMSETITTQ